MSSNTQRLTGGASSSGTAVEEDPKALIDTAVDAAVRELADGRE